MKLAFHLPKHPSHDYLFIVYLESLLRYCRDIGIQCEVVEDLGHARHSVVLCDTDYLDWETVQMLKERGNKVVGFNLIDSSGIAQACAGHFWELDLIFSVTGLQLTNVGYELVIDGDFQFAMEERQFMPPEQWQRFDGMRRAGRLLSLPYVHWEHQPEVGHIPMEQKNGKVMVRGGAHFLRVILAYCLMRDGLLDSASGFTMRDFFLEGMAEQFRYCHSCRSDFAAAGGVYRYRAESGNDECTSPAVWGQHLDLSSPGSWNNRCPGSFYWLADRFVERHGALDKGQLEKLFNASFVSPQEHQHLLRTSSFTSDLKWLHSIYAAQRFWDAAIVGTVNLLPTRTADQVYFPEMFPGEHYLTYSESMDRLKFDTQASLEQQEHIRQNCWALYSHWIRPGDYRLNPNLLQHIVDRITAL